MQTFERFTALWGRLCAAPVAPVWSELDSAYREPQRSYHNWEHIEAMLSALDGCRSLSGLKTAQLDQVEAAIFFHDVVYDARARDNEAQSAEMFCRHALADGVSKDNVEHVVAMTLATAAHDSSDDGPTRLLLDLDLEVLGRPPVDYDFYVAKVRQEYRHVSDEHWRVGRAALLRRFLERSVIFQTSLFRRLEGPARRNLSREIETLEG